MDYRLTQTGEQVQEALNQVPTNTENIGSLESGKVDKEAGKGLSQENFTSGEKSKLGALPNNADLQAALNAKQDTINDLADIRSGAAAGATAYQKPNTGIPQSAMDADVQAKLNAAGSSAADIAAERLARETADLAINEALGTKLNQSQVSALIAAAVANFVTGSDVQTAITTALAPYSTTDATAIAIQNAITTALANYYAKSAIDTMLAGKVDKVNGKGLSENDFTDTLKTKLDALPTASGLASQISTAIATALTDYYTKSQVDSALADKQTAAQVATAISTALASYSTTAQMNAAITAALTSYYTKAEIDLLLAAKQAVISDLDVIRSGASKGNTAYQKPQSGIPMDDLAGTLQSKINAADGAAASAAQAAASAEDAAEDATAAATSAAAAQQKLTDLETYLSGLDPESAASVAAALGLFEQEVEENYAKKNGYYKEMRTGLADNIVDERPFTEMGQLHMTASTVEVAGSPKAITYPSKDIADGQSQVLQLQGNGAAFMQLYPCGTNGDFSADSDCPNDLPVRYSNAAGTTEMGYLDLSEVLLVSDLTASDCALLSAILTADAARGCTTGWLDEAGNELAVSVSEGSATWTLAATSAAATPTKVVRRAIRVKASEANRGSESWWFTSGSTLRQIRDMAVKEGIDGTNYSSGNTYWLTKPFDTCSLADWIHYQEAKEGTVGIESQNAGTLEGAKLFQLKAVTSANLLDPETGVAELAWYKDEGEGVDGQYTIIGLPAGATLSLESKVTGLTSTPAVDAAGHLLVGGHSLLHITSATGLAGCSVIATYDGSLDQEPADEYAAQVLSIDVTKVYGKLNGEGEYVQVAAEGLRALPNVNLFDLCDFVNATADILIGDKALGSINWSYSSSDKYFSANISDKAKPAAQCKYLLSNRLVRCNKVHTASNTEDLTMSDHTAYKNNIWARYMASTDPTAFKTWLTNNNVHLYYQLDASAQKHYTSLIYRQSGQPDIPLSQLTRSLQVCNWATTKAVCPAATETTVGSTTSAKPNSASPVVKSQFSSNIPEQVDSLDARVTALEQAIANMSN